MVWTQSLSVGVTSIDSQHKMWFDKANALFDACSQGKGRAYISELLDFLTDYTHTHFTDEENYMLKINYPRYSIQKKLHADFIAQLNKLKQDLNASQGNLTVVINANTLLLNWFTNHISAEDKQIGDFIKTTNT